MTPEEELQERRRDQIVIDGVPFTRRCGRREAVADSPERHEEER
jgi:hypothetical protein